MTFHGVAGSCWGRPVAVVVNGSRIVAERQRNVHETQHQKGKARLKGRQRLDWADKKDKNKQGDARGCVQRRRHRCYVAAAERRGSNTALRCAEHAQNMCRATPKIEEQAHSRITVSRRRAETGKAAEGAAPANGARQRMGAHGASRF